MHSEDRYKSSRDPVSPWTVLFGPTFDIPVVISEGIPEGKIQFWKDDEMLWELTIEEV
jgi:hypothetical protein